jgi:hypothetical protein
MTTIDFLSMGVLSVGVGLAATSSRSAAIKPDAPEQTVVVALANTRRMLKR